MSLRPWGMALATLLASVGAVEAGWLGTLGGRCPAKRLDWLNPGILIDGIEDFRNGLPKPVRARIETIAKRDLARCEAGAGCVNAAYIRAVDRAGLIGRLARAVCAMPYRCTAPFECQSDT